MKVEIEAQWMTVSSRCDSWEEATRQSMLHKRLPPDLHTLCSSMIEPRTKESGEYATGRACNLTMRFRRQKYADMGKSEAYSHFREAGLG